MTTCTCGRPTRNDAYGCDDCVGELSRTFAEVPFLVEELDVTLTGQRGKRPGAGTRSGNGLPWNEKASKVAHALHEHLATTVRLCTSQHIAHQSPYHGLPADDPDSMSRWLLWRVDGLAYSPQFADILNRAAALADRVAHVIDRPPDRMFLGMCDLAKIKLCDGAVYATVGNPVGKCRECGMKYDAEDKRRSLEDALDDKLVTASEIAHLATYLGVPAKRDTVRKVVNQWHKRKRLLAAGGTDKEPRFRYGDVAPLLSAAYDRKEA